MCSQCLRFQLTLPYFCYEQNNNNVKEAVDRLSQKNLATLWIVFSRWIKECAERINANVSPVADEDTLSYFLAISTMAIFSIENVSVTKPKGLETSVVTMNDLLKLIDCKKTGINICEMSAQFWKTNSEVECLLSANVIEWLLKQTEKVNATGMVNKRLK